MKKCKHPQCLVKVSDNAPDYCPDHNTHNGIKTQPPVRLPNIRSSYKVIAIEVLEGNGKSDNPWETVVYLVSEAGEIMGKVDRNWRTRPTPTS